ncbi:aldehyde dehydrogenase family protein, partial [Burkholderia gladioli]
MNAVIQEPVAAVQTVPLLIDGEFVESRSAQWRDIVNPATQQVLARVPFATAEEIDAAIEAAQAAFASWKNTPLGARVRVMLRFQALVREHMPRIAKVLTAEQGKTLPDAEGD